MQLQYCVKREKCKVNDVIFPSGCEARAINLRNKNMKIGYFTGGTSVRLKNIFTDISRYPTGKHEINLYFRVECSFCFNSKGRVTPNQKSVRFKFFINAFRLYVAICV